MQYQSFKCNSQKEYLGFCEQKGFIYSVQTDVNQFAVVALFNGRITTLISYATQQAVYGASRGGDNVEEVAGAYCGETSLEGSNADDGQSSQL
ncbi:hypothetical protein [Paenibacillus sp. PAMC21692]|uniref:hypothetical protein n=1 Tax=Paenibacillus sp. PAMC21692 TaxID=2762320 RepID=UPI00164CE066|nr:hypothetical protein [Paenibacillus sp. PAMC21692]QNK57444.1 hypothetical protein H7F31_00110 [Paenibacillus sp. PAMC21692]